MMILSSFRDYYDACASHGVDVTVQYHRKPRQYSLRDETGPEGELIKDFNRYLQGLKDRLPPLTGRVPLVFVGFCGKVYVGLRPRVECSNGRIFRNVVYLGQPEPALEIQTMWDARDIHPEDLDAEFRRYRFFSNKGEKTIRHWLATKGPGPVDEEIDLFQRQRAVSFVVHDDTLIFDPCLQDYRFQRVVGGVEAFQMIEMFITGVLGVSANPMIELTDQDRIQAHGFDKHSFRKAPTKHT